MAAYLPMKSRRTLEPMSEIHRDAIRLSQALLVQDLDVREIMDDMIQYGVISDHKRELIMAINTRRERIRTFLDILLRSGENAFEVFQKALGKSFPHLANAVQLKLKKLQDPQYQDVAYDHDASSISYFGNAAGNTWPDEEWHNNEVFYGSSTNLKSLNPVGLYQDLSIQCSLASDSRSIRSEAGSSTTEDHSYLVKRQDNENYIDDITKKISETCCYQSTGTQSMVCTENCKAKLMNERLTKQKHGSLDESPEGPETVPITKGDCFFLDNVLKPAFEKGRCKDKDVQVWDKLGRLLLVPHWALKMYGDPCGEPWFYPLPLTAQQASMILKPYERSGVFLVYIPQQRYETQGVKFNLSVLARTGNGNDGFKPMHLHVNGISGGHVQLLEGQFSCIQELVAHHKLNKGQLPCRLRLSPKEVDRKITPGEHYDKNWYIDQEDLDWPDDNISITEGTNGNVQEAYFDMIAVAVKQRSVNHRLDPWSFENFFEEAQILSELNHRNVVQLMGFSFESVANPYIVMEYVEGTLLECIKYSKLEKTVATVMKMFKQLLMALRYLESKTYVIHRNVEARNILLGESKCLKLADFGLAKMVNYDCYKSEGKRLKVRWSAPEVLRDGHFSTKSDVWSSGVVLWEILSDGSQPPYGKLSPSQIVKTVPEGGRLSCPNGHSTAIHDIFRVVSQRCWRTSPRDRTSASDLLDVIATKMSEYNDSTSQAALYAGVYLPDPEFQYLSDKHIRKGILPKNIQKKMSNYDYARSFPDK